MRRTRLVVALVLVPAFASVCLTSCAGPVAFGPDRFGIGLYRTQSHNINPDVTYLSIEGIGLLFTPGRVSLGYAQDDLVAGRLDNRNYLVRTPLADFAVGEAAQDAAIESVFPDGPHLEKGERHD